MSEAVYSTAYYEVVIKPQQFYSETGTPTDLTDCYFLINKLTKVQEYRTFVLPEAINVVKGFNDALQAIFDEQKAIADKSVIEIS